MAKRKPGGTGSLFNSDAYLDISRIPVRVWDTLGELRNGQYRLVSERQPDGSWERP